MIPLPPFLRREQVAEIVAEAVAEERRRCAAIARRAFEGTRQNRPDAAQLAERIRQQIEDGDPGF